VERIYKMDVLGSITIDMGAGRVDGSGLSAVFCTFLFAVESALRTEYPQSMVSYSGIPGGNNNPDAPYGGSSFQGTGCLGASSPFRFCVFIRYLYSCHGQNHIGQRCSLERTNLRSRFQCKIENRLALSAAFVDTVWLLRDNIKWIKIIRYCFYVLRAVK